MKFECQIHIDSLGFFELDQFQLIQFIVINKMNKSLLQSPI